jgi:hypothetical protein
MTASYPDATGRSGPCSSIGPVIIIAVLMIVMLPRIRRKL